MINKIPNPVSQKRNNRLTVFWGGVCLVWLVVACSGIKQAVKPVSTMETNGKAPGPDTMAEQTSWILLDDNLANASQAEVGAEIYRLVCSACHGDVGQGLTPDWLATWKPEDQNCWQSKCHGKIHPPDGFELPRYSPAVKGSFFPTLFPTALDLYSYLKRTMPWHAPGTMMDEEYWQVSAFLLVLNGVDLGGTILDANTAGSVSLK